MNTDHRPTRRPTLFLIDGYSQMYRAYHAIRGLTGPGGRSTNAVYGFVTMLRKLIADQRPELIACAFDLAGPTFRDALVADYKANRPAMPDDLAEQIPYVHRACEALGVPILSCQGFEADDVIGTVAERATSEGYQVVIVTGDKDMFQLVRDGVRVFNPRDEGTWFDADGVKEKFGVPPEQVVDVLALTGDSIDNIKGVPGRRREGRARTAHDVRVARRAARARGRGDAEEVPRGAARATPTWPGRAASWRGSAATRRSTCDIEAFRYRGPEPAGVLRAVRRTRLPVAAQRVRADGRRRSPGTTRLVETTRGGARRWRRS